MLLEPLRVSATALVGGESRNVLAVEPHFKVLFALNAALDGEINVFRNELYICSGNRAKARRCLAFCRLC